MAISKQIWEQAKEKTLAENNSLDSVQILRNVYKEIFSHFDFDDVNNSQDEDENPMPDELDVYEDYIPNPDSQYEDRFENLD